MTIEKEKPKFGFKVIVNNLPPYINDKNVHLHLDIPAHNYKRFVKYKSFDGSTLTRLYLNFMEEKSFWMFRKYDGLILKDKENDYALSIEFALFQKIPKSKKTDLKMGTIFEDEDYKSFLSGLESEPSLKTKDHVPFDKWIEEIEQKELEMKKGYIEKSTPLLEYISQQKVEKRDAVKKLREEKLSTEKRTNPSVPRRVVIVGGDSETNKKVIIEENGKISFNSVDRKERTSFKENSPDKNKLSSSKKSLNDSSQTIKTPIILSKDKSINILKPEKSSTLTQVKVDETVSPKTEKPKFEISGNSIIIQRKPVATEENSSEKTPVTNENANPKEKDTNSENSAKPTQIGRKERQPIQLYKPGRGLISKPKK